MKLIRVLLIGAAVAGLLGGLAGCKTAITGKATEAASWVKGEMQVRLEKKVDKVNAAVERAGQDLGLFALTADKDLLGGKFVYRNAQDDRITVSTVAQTDGATLLSIRVGTFGDQQQSQLILDRIRSRL